MSMREREKIQKVLRGIDQGELESKHSSRSIKLAGIQISASSDRDSNIQKALSFARVALDRGAEILCFPELFSIPWLNINDKENYTALAETVPGPSTEKFIGLMSEYQTVCICPIFEVHKSEYYNSAVIIGPHGILGVYRKLHLPDLPFWEERQFFSPGPADYPVFDTPMGRIAVQLGWDVFFPESFRLLAGKGAEIVFVPTAAALASRERWQHVVGAQAIMNNLFIFRVNRVGSEQGLTFYGQSSCVDPFGECPAEPVFHKDAVVIAEIDPGMVSLARKEFPFLSEIDTGIFPEIRATS